MQQDRNADQHAPARGQSARRRLRSIRSVCRSGH